MRVSKGVVFGILALDAVVAAFLFTHKWGIAQSAGAAVMPSAATPAASSPGNSILPPGSEPRPREYADWNAMVRDYAAAHPENQGLPKLADALAAIDSKALGKHKQVLDAIVEKGWAAAATPEFDAAIRSQGPVLDAAFTAAAAAPCPMPPVFDFKTPLPNFLSTQMLSKLMLVTARMAEGADPNQAALRCVAEMRLSGSFCGTEASLISHLIGRSGVSLGAKTLGSVLRNPAVTPQTAQIVLDSLKDLEGRWAGMSEVVKTEARAAVRSVRLAKSNPQGLGGSVDKKTLDLLAAITDVQKFEQEVERVARAMVENTGKPAFSRQHLTVAQLTTDPNVIAISGTDFWEASVRADVSVANVRLCEALAILKTGNQEAVRTVADPFADKPVTVLADRVYSLGPDQTDQQGATAFDPTNGTLSAGDVVMPR